MKKTVKVLIIALCFTVLSLSTLLFTSCKCEHERSEWQIVTAATCESEGVESRKCSKCDNTEIKKIDALWHDFVNYTYNNNALCTKDGTKTAKCSRCTKKNTITADNTALGHVEIIDVAVEPTCTEPGLTAGKHCSRCNEVLVKQQTVNARGGHKNKNGICLICHEDISTKGLEYVEGAEENTLIVVGLGTSTNKDVIIPAFYEGKKIVSIGNECFKSKSILSVDIPDSITIIGEYSFSGCVNLVKINIPEGVVSIGNSAFSDCRKLTNVTIPESVMNIGSGVFSGCVNLVKVDIPDSVTNMGMHIFYKCDRLTSVTIGSGIESIEQGTFYQCGNLTSVLLGNSIKRIRNAAFSRCVNLENLVIPKTVSDIENNAFLDCDKLIQKDNGVYYVDSWVVDANSNIIKAHIKEGTLGIANNALSNCKNLINAYIPDSVSSIGDYAFGECENLRNITIPAGIKNIGNMAFCHCTNLSEVNYKGMEEQWNKIAIGRYNENLTNAKRNYI